MRNKNVETPSIWKTAEYEGLKNAFDKLNKDYYGDPYSLSYYRGFKKETESAVNSLNETVKNLTDRVKELEKIIKVAGIVEELDTTDVVELPDSNGYTLRFATSDTVTFGEGKKQYVINKVN